MPTRDQIPECFPATHEAVDMYPVSYVKALEEHASSLEQHTAELEKSLSQRVPGSVADHLYQHSTHAHSQSQSQTQTQPQSSRGRSAAGPIETVDGTSVAVDVFADGSNSTDPLYSYLPPFDPANYDLSMLEPTDDLFSIIPPQAAHLPTSRAVQQQQPPPPTVDQGSDTTVPIHTLSQSTGPTLSEVSINEGATFFQTYFEVIHPRYPFLDVEECSRAYLEWKTGVISIVHVSGWSSYLVKMIFANGLILQQARLDHTTRRHHRDLMLEAQTEQSIMTDSSYAPLVRIQAMLLYAIHALHGESTSRIVHIIGVVMRFAVLHRFHHLHNDGSPTARMKIKAWSCIYNLDKMVAITLQIPTYPGDEWISSPTFETQVEPQFAMPWALDLPGIGEEVVYNFDLSYHAHMCRIRQLQSRILVDTQRLSEAEMPGYLDDMRRQIDAWAENDTLRAFGRPNTEGHASTLGLRHVGHLTRVVLYSSARDMSSRVSDELLQACCDTCAAFRALQKKRQIPKHWFDMLFQFQVGVTILYIMWRRATVIPKAVDRAIRDCTTALAIFADRSQNADIYRDCADALASSIWRATPPGTIDDESRRELAKMVSQIEEVGLAAHVLDKLSEMCHGSQPPSEMDRIGTGETMEV